MPRRSMPTAGELKKTRFDYLFSMNHSSANSQAKVNRLKLLSVDEEDCNGKMMHGDSVDLVRTITVEKRQFI